MPALSGYRTVEEFLKKLNETGEYYIDPKANEIHHQGGSLTEQLSEALDLYQQEKTHSATGIPDSPIVERTVSLITTARLRGAVLDKEALKQKLKETEERLGDCIDQNNQLRNQNTELQKKLREPSRKR